MGSWTGTGRALPVSLLTILLGAAADPAFADLTIFAGSASTTPRTTVGAALGLSLQPVGVEFEYGDTPADPHTARPALSTGLFNLVLGASLSTDRRVLVYGSVGGGVYRERLGGYARTDLAASGGGGIYLRLTGPFRVRFDYRLFVLRGNSLHRRPRRAYAALSVAF